MTDERFDQILKQALTPKNNDLELKIKKKVRTHDMKKITKRVIALAACAAVCFGSYCAVDYYSTTNSVEDTVLEEINNTFTIKAYAQNLTSSTPIHIAENEINGGVLSGYETKGTVGYCYNLPLICEGEAIQTITYSINKGCFQIIEPIDNSYLVDYKEHTTVEDINFGSCGGNSVEVSPDGSVDAKEQILYLDSFTVDYNRQSGEDFFINIGNVIPNMQEAIELIWNSDYSAENTAKALNMLFSGVEITITVTFEDGTQSSKVIGLESTVTEGEVERLADILLKEL